MTNRDLVTQRFTERIDNLLSHHHEMKLAIHNKKNEITLMNELVVQFVLMVAVLWESHLSELILTYAEMAPKKALKSLESRIKRSVEGKFGASTRRAVSVTLPVLPTKAQLIRLLDQKGWNITATTADKLSSKANEWLRSRYARKFALDSADSEFFNYAISIRNYLGHFSDGSRSVLAKSAAALSEPDNQPLKGQLGKIGTYLRTSVSTEKSRAEFFADRVKQIAEKL